MRNVENSCLGRADSYENFDTKDFSHTEIVSVRTGHDFDRRKKCAQKWGYHEKKMGITRRCMSANLHVADGLCGYRRRNRHRQCRTGTGGDGGSSG